MAKLMRVVGKNETKYRLTLNYDEARYVAQVLANVGGDPVESSRRYTEPVARAFAGEGFDFDQRRVDGQILELHENSMIGFLTPGEMREDNGYGVYV